MAESGRELVERLHREALEQIRAGLLLEPPERRKEPALDLPPVPPDSSIAQEWEMFRQEVRRLLAGGDKGRFALVKAGQEITVWDSLRDADQAARLLYGGAPCLVQPILPRLWSLRAG